MAIVLKDGERLYLRAWEYNAARIISELAKIVINHGGRVKPTHTAIISNRTLTDIIREIETRMNELNNAILKHGRNENRTYALKKQAEELEKYTGINNDPITVTHTSYITFILDDVYYYYQTDNNPFFDFYYHKTPIKNGKYSKDAALEPDKKEWLYDCFFGSTCAQADIIEGANLIFNMLCNAPMSVIMRDGKKQRVSNKYDGGYHIEMIYAPERIGTVEF